MLAGIDRCQHQGARDAVAADQLDDDVDVAVGDDLARVADHRHPGADDAAGAIHIEVGDHGDLDATPGAAANFRLVALQHLERAAADGTDTEQADLDGFERVHWECRLR